MSRISDRPSRRRLVGRPVGGTVVTALLMGIVASGCGGATDEADPTAAQSVTRALTTDVVGLGAVTTDPVGPDHRDGTEVTLTAMPDPGWLFDGWTGDVTSSENPLTISMNADTAVTATFTGGSSTGDTASGAGPVIDVWYGDEQSFGQNGMPQRAVNVLGNVTDPDGIATFTFTLNGDTPRELTVGPDARRLQFPGDFNAEIAYDELSLGENVVELVATDGLLNVSRQTVTIQFTEGSAPLPTSYEWSSVSTPTDLAQVVDGRWEIQDGALRPGELGFDRLVALGDMSWTDYEVTVPVTVHGLGPDSGTAQSGEPLLGMGLRWIGHEPEPKAQPAIDFYPIGAYAWYRWQDDGRIELRGNFDSPIDRTSASLEFDVPYIMKARAQDTVAGTTYEYKMWPASESEPDWQVQFTYDSGLPSGGVVLVAHHVDVSIGDVAIAQLP